MHANKLPITSDLIDLNALVAASHGLAPLPESSMRLASLLADDEWDMDDIAAIVRLDPPLTGRVLGLVNSAAMGIPNKITDVNQALVRLGPGAVLGLAVGPQVKRELQPAMPIYDLTEGALWRHSVAVALTVEQANAIARLSAPPEAFVAALLHDIGKLILGRYLRSQEADLIYQSYQLGHHGFVAAETEILGVHHGEVGALIAQHWQLPELIVAGIQHHHDVDGVEDQATIRICDLIALGDYVASTIGAEDGEPQGPLASAVTDRLGVDGPMLDRLCEMIGERLDDVIASYAA